MTTAKPTDRDALTRGLSRVSVHASKARGLLAKCEGVRGDAGREGYLDALEEVRKMLDEVTVLRAIHTRLGDDANGLT